MKKSHDNCSIKLVWRVIDSHWCCISCPEITVYLFDYLWGFGFVIPPSIRCCIAENCCYKLIFRRRGGKIITIIHQKF